MERHFQYMKFVAEGVSESEKALLEEAVQRNQLTGSERFFNEVEERHGLRVGNRGRCRSSVGEK